MMMGLLGRSLFAHAYGQQFYGAPLVPLFNVLVVAGVVLFLVWAARCSRYRLAAACRMAPIHRREDSVRIARERLARGEMSRDEYERILPLL